MLGLLDDQEASEMRGRLPRRHPEIDEAATREARGEEPPEPQYPVILRPTGDLLEPYAASAIFGPMLTLPEADLRHAMLEGIRMGSSMAFGVLQDLCYGFCKVNPERAVALAELGVQLMEIQQVGATGQVSSWRAEGWAFLARIQLFAGDHAGAERGLSFALEVIQDGSRSPAGTRDVVEPWAEVEVRRTEAMVRMHQDRDRAVAAAALDRAVELARTLPDDEPARVNAVYERLSLAAFTRDAEIAWALCDEIEGLIDAGAAGIDRVDMWRGFVAYHRGKACAARGRDDLAEKYWRETSEHIRKDQEATDPPGAAVYETALLGSFVTHELARLAGRYYKHLEVYDILLREAIERYRQARVTVFEAAAEAELAALCALRGRPDEARQLATATADFLDALPSHRAAWNAAYQLRGLANGNAEAPADALEDVLWVLCEDLDTLRWEITGFQAMPAAEARRANGMAHR